MVFLTAELALVIQNHLLTEESVNTTTMTQALVYMLENKHRDMLLFGEDEGMFGFLRHRSFAQSPVSSQ